MFLLFKLFKGFYKINRNFLIPYRCFFAVFKAKINPSLNDWWIFIFLRHMFPIIFYRSEKLYEAYFNLRTTVNVID